MSDYCCPEEAVQQSQFSEGGVVESEELVLRAIYRSDDIDPEGKLAKTNMSVTQMIEPQGNGFSVNRLNGLNTAIVAEIVEEFESKSPSNAVRGFYAARVGALRELLTDTTPPIKMC